VPTETTCKWPSLPAFIWLHCGRRTGWWELWSSCGHRRKQHL